MNFTSWNSLPSGAHTSNYAGPNGPTSWESRREGVKAVLLELLNRGDAVGMQGVDSFFWLLHEIRETNSSIHGIWVINTAYASALDSDNETSLLNDVNNTRTFESEYCPAEFAASRCSIARKRTHEPLKSKFHAPAGLALFWDSDKMSVVSSISSVGWYSWGVIGHLCYGYSSHDHFTVVVAHNCASSPIPVCIANLSRGNQAGEQLAQIASEVSSSLRSADEADSLVLLVHSRNDELDLMDTFVQVSADGPTWCLPCANHPETGKLLMNKCGKVLARSQASLHWEALNCPAAFWTPPQSHQNMLQWIQYSMECAALLNAVCERDLLREGVQHFVASRELNNYLNQIAAELQVTADSVMEALMCLSPNQYAPSLHQPVSARYLP